MPAILTEQTLVFDGHPLITGLGSEFEVEPARVGAFVRVTAKETNSRFKLSLGRLANLERYLVCHRYEPFWMKPAVGDDLGRVPPETQFLLARLGGGGWVVLVPLLDDPLRFSLQGGPEGTLELLAETGDAWLPAQQGTALYVAAGPDPFALMRNAAPEVMEHLGTGRLRRDKPLPAFVDQFGWCTWDAFYADVSAEGVRQGLESFARGGVPLKMMILDDGWLDMRRLPTGEKRLVSFDANQKFEGGLSPLIDMAKRDFGVQTLLVWHTIVGYWGGVDKALGYEVIDQLRHFGEGILSHVPTFDIDWWGQLVGYVPEHTVGRFFDDFHARLAEQGVDGVKVDSQAVLEALAQGQGGRVRVSRAYRKALEASVQKHFDGRLINCMSNAQEAWYYSPDSTLLRSSIDFFPNRPDLHGLHLYTNAMVGLWFGEFMHPDWDMFQSTHPLGAFHAAGRAVSGSPVYVSDKPGQHDFELLRKLVLSDGGVLRADRPGLPTMDCLLVDPTRESVLLKIWNRNGPAAVIGAFNCFYDGASDDELAIKGRVSPDDVPDFDGERFAVFSHQANVLAVLDRRTEIELALRPGEFEVFSLVPVQHDFAALGLADKFNGRAAVLGQSWSGTERVVVDLKDGGRALFYSKRAPSSLRINGRETAFDFHIESGRLGVTLGETGVQQVTVDW